MTADTTVGLPFSRVYGRPEKLLENSERLRHRLGNQIELIFFPDPKGRAYLAQGCGRSFQTAAAAVVGRVQGVVCRDFGLISGAVGHSPRDGGWHVMASDGNGLRVSASGNRGRTMNDDNVSFEFDVAISFRTADLGLAEQLKARLEPPLRVFVFSRHQEDVAAKDGMDAFRTVFRHRARLSVVLFRKGWGDTPWTGVEEVAIKDRCLATKYRSLVLVVLDDAPAPAWVPDSYQHFDLKRLFVR